MDVVVVGRAMTKMTMTTSRGILTFLWERDWTVFSVRSLLHFSKKFEDEDLESG